jgi:coniferyl-aldehyde dehydrogenase
MSDLEPARPQDSKVFMQDIFEQQKHAFAAMPYPTYRDRKEMLKALKRCLIKNKERLIKSMSADFSHRSSDSLIITRLPAAIAAARGPMDKYNG